MRRIEVFDAGGDLERSIEEMSYHPLLALADELSGEADVRRREEGDPGPFLERLIAFLQGIEHAISGGLALRTYLRERPTLDFDVLVSESAWERVQAFVSREGLTPLSAAQDIYSFGVPGTRMGFDVRVARSPLWKASLVDTVDRRVFGKTVRVLNRTPWRP